MRNLHLSRTLSTSRIVWAGMLSALLLALQAQPVSAAVRGQKPERLKVLSS